MSAEHQIIPVTDLTLPELALFTQRRETQLLHFYEPKPGLFLAESPNVIQRALEAGYRPVSFLVDAKQCGRRAHDGGAVSPAPAELWQRYPDSPVYAAPAELLEQITGFQLTRGMLCLMKRKELSTAAQLCSGMHRIVVLENVMNPANVGAIFRSAAALGAEAVLLTDGCSDPLYRRAARVSMGTVFQVPWTFLPKDLTPQERLRLLEDMGFKTAAMALTDRSVPLGDPGPAGEAKLAVILGTEGEGLCAETVANASYTIRIPMKRGVDSLNVAAASAVALWELCRR